MEHTRLSSVRRPGTKSPRLVVGDIMSRYPETIRADATVQEAAVRMRAFGVGFLPVVRGQEVVGVVTDRDLVTRILLLPGRESPKLPVGVIMTRDVIYCERGTSLPTIARTFSVLQIRRMPVLEEGRELIGVIGLADLVQAGQGRIAAHILGEICRVVALAPRPIPDPLRGDTGSP